MIEKAVFLVSWLFLAGIAIDILRDTRKIRRLLEQRPPPVDPETFR